MRFNNYDPHATGWTFEFKSLAGMIHFKISKQSLYLVNLSYLKCIPEAQIENRSDVDQRTSAYLLIIDLT